LKTLLTTLSILVFRVVAGQTPIDILESTLKIAGFSEEVFYLGFAEGDRVIFNFQEVGGKDVKELEIMEWPASVRFAEFRVSKVENKSLSIPRKGVYKFRVANSAIGGRVCHVRIQRIPANNAPDNFNTNVYWKLVNDTIKTPVTQQYLLRSDTTIINVVDQTTKVSSQTALNGNSNRTVVDFDLPQGTVSWSYYLGVGPEGREAFNAASEKFTATAIKQVSKIEGYGTMAALAIYGLNLFAQVQGRDNVKYWIIPDWNDVLLFQSRQAFQIYKFGDVINDASRMAVPAQGKVYIGLENDNLVEPIEVLIKVTAVTVVQQWAERIIEQTTVTQRNEPFIK
jgi:hypothetical protein